MFTHFINTKEIKMQLSRAPWLLNEIVLLILHISIRFLSLHCIYLNMYEPKMCKITSIFLFVRKHYLETILSNNHQTHASVYGKIIIQALRCHN